MAGAVRHSEIGGRSTDNRSGGQRVRRPARLQAGESGEDVCLSTDLRQPLQAIARRINLVGGYSESCNLQTAFDQSASAIQKSCVQVKGVGAIWCRFCCHRQISVSVELLSVSIVVVACGCCCLLFVVHQTSQPVSSRVQIEAHTSQVEGLEDLVLQLAAGSRQPAARRSPDRMPMTLRTAADAPVWSSQAGCLTCN